MAVYDLGGGTFDLSILELREGVSLPLTVTQLWAEMMWMKPLLNVWS